MKKIILIDGNNLMFRSYYATAYTGNTMKNSKDFPTNGLSGFVNMVNKIINEESPEYMMVAFDIGKTFRHEKYTDYKGGRSETPDDLKVQFPVAKKILTAMGIKYLEKEGYEADDIIGTFANMIDNNENYEGLIVSSDKDLLQLISEKNKVKLLKSKDYIMMDRKQFFETYEIEPIRMIDLKGLMGDPSDNIKGVKGIGEKTAIKLLKEYNSVEGIYEHIDEIKGANQKKLIEGKESAFESKELATIYKEVPLEEDFDSIKYIKQNNEELLNIYKDLEFYSFIKQLNVKKQEIKDINVEIVNDMSNVNINELSAIYIDTTIENYHKTEIRGIAIYNDNESIYIPSNILTNLSFIKSKCITYNLKKLIVLCLKNNYEIPNVTLDIMLSAYLLNYNIKDDITYLASEMNYDLNYEDKKEETINDIALKSVLKAKFIYEIKDKLIEEMKEKEVNELYYNIEHPLSKVLAKMEYNGIKCDANTLTEMGKDIEKRVQEIQNEIYEMAGTEFNISSPKQLGEVLFEKLGLKHGKKNKSGSYKTDEQTLQKLIEYPIVKLVLEYRMLTKLYSTYIEGLKNNILEDGKIHTIYTQTLTRTGRLSSIEPNLQNIPVRNEYGKLIRKAFLPDANSVLLSSDYSQIELRIFSHLANIEKMKEAFINNIDIHTKTASDVYKVDIKDVTKTMRRNAKAVNFGIIYGISTYGLSTDLGISVKEAKEFIDNYFETYPGIKTYMDNCIKEAHEKGYVKTIMNRKRIIDELNNTNYMIRSMGERMALNTPIQGSSADILKKAMIDINEEFEKNNLKSTMLLQVHDELIFNVLNDELEIVKKLVKEKMENAYKLSIPMEVDINIGNNWYDAK